MEPLKLAFDDEALERAFRDHYGRRRLSQVRFVFGAGVLLYAVFGVLDALVASEVLVPLWLIRFAFVCPVLLLALGGSYLAPQRFLRHHQGLVASTVVVGGIGIVAMTAIARPPTSHHYYAGLMLVITLGFTVASLRFLAATVAAWIIVGAYELSALFVERAPSAIVLSNSFFLLSSCFVGMLACYSMERLERRAFLDQGVTERASRELAALNQQLEEIALRDALTGLLSRRRLDERLTELIAHVRRYRTPASVMLIDLDGFKAVNDRYGHPTGDEVLRQVAAQLLRHVRETDLVFRYGGDEFCVLLPNTELHTTQTIGERVLCALEQVSLPGCDELAGIGMSAGVVAVGRETADAAELLARADSLLYQAKREGRGRIVIDDRAGPAAAPADSEPTA